MTDARASRAALSVLSRPTPQAVASKVAVSVLTRANAAVTEPRASRVALSVLVRIPPTEARASRLSLSLLIRIPPPGPTTTFWDGIALQDVDLTASGYWDGADFASNGFDFDASGEWDGAAIQPLA